MAYSNETLFNTHKAKIYHEILRDFAKHCVSLHVNGKHCKGKAKMNAKQ